MVCCTHSVSLGQQELSTIGAILSGYISDQSNPTISFGHCGWFAFRGGMWSFIVIEQSLLSDKCRLGPCVDQVQPIYLELPSV